MKMTDKDAMSPSTEDAIKYLGGMIFPQDFSPSTLRAVAVNEMAIAALRAQLECEKEHIGETTDMMPLTLDELREMGKTDWVWLTFPELPSEESGWYRAKQVYATYSHKHYGETWIAYSTKPKEDANG